MNNLLLRALSGTVYITVIVACILLGKYWFSALTAAFIVLGIFEFHNLEAAREGRSLGLIARCLDLIASLSLWAVTVSFFDNSGLMGWTFILIFFVTLALILCNTVFSKSDKAYHTTAQSFLCLAYIALPLSFLNVVYFSLPYSEGVKLILTSFICLWLNDTGAYLVGSKIGRRRLCERLSPKKSWEGFWGGLILVVIAMTVYSIIEDKNVIAYACYGAAVSVLATVGDLFESLLKRTAGVKDSGKLIPGHGGILDRIDSFLFVSYAIILMWGYYLISIVYE